MSTKGSRKNNCCAGWRETARSRARPGGWKCEPQDGYFRSKTE